MLNTNPKKKSDPAMAARLKKALENAPSQVAIAEACNVTAQAVTGWIKNGRIHKNHLPIISRMCNVDLNWLITGSEADASQSRIESIVEEIKDWDDQLLAEVKAQIDLIKRRRDGLL